MDDFLKSNNYGSLLGSNNVDWSVNEVIKQENKMAFYFKNTKKDIIITEEDEKLQRNNNICQFCDKNFESDTVRHLCHLTGKHKGPAHSKYIINVTQKQSNFFPFLFHNFYKYDCHLFFENVS